MGYGLWFVGYGAWLAKNFGLRVYGLQLTVYDPRVTVQG
jgi:hypothetical protein